MGKLESVRGENVRTSVRREEEKCPDKQDKNISESSVRKEYETRVSSTGSPDTETGTFHKANEFLAYQTVLGDIPGNYGTRGDR